MLRIIRMIWWLIRDPHYVVPCWQYLDRWEYKKDVVIWRPFNRPFFKPRVFHFLPLVRALRVFALMRRKCIHEDELLDLYDRYKKEMYDK